MRRVSPNYKKQIFSKTPKIAPTKHEGDHAYMKKLYINPGNKVSHINPELQGHFSEHLGRCIYEGLFVGDNSDIPNVKGMRKDVVEALKEMQIPVLRWPGGCFADGRNRS